MLFDTLYIYIIHVHHPSSIVHDPSDPRSWPSRSVVRKRCFPGRKLQQIPRKYCSPAKSMSSRNAFYMEYNVNGLFI